MNQTGNRELVFFFRYQSVELKTTIVKMTTLFLFDFVLSNTHRDRSLAEH